MADVLIPVVMSREPSIPPPLIVGTVMSSAKVGERYKTTFSVPVISDHPIAVPLD